MFSKKVLWLVLLLPSCLTYPEAQRSQIDSVRGNSFGLENFLFQPYDNLEVKDTLRLAKPKRTRPTTLDARIPAPNRGHTYGLENLNAQLYESSRLKPTPEKPEQEQPKKRIPEPTVESNRIRENFVVKPEPELEVTQEPDTSTPQIGTERIRKRIMMRRRRKRPPNAIQSEGNGEITGNAILKSVRIPIYPQVPKVVIRTKLPDQNNVSRLQLEGLKSVITPPTEIETTVEITAQKKLTATEKSTVSTTIATTSTEKPSTINLKAFLKQQTETLSLSELLQTQNLSLADLLRGNKDASAILKARQGITSTTAATNTRRKQNDKKEDQKAENPAKRMDILEITTSRSSYNGFQPKIPRTKISDQANSKPAEETEDNSAKPLKRLPDTSEPSGFDPQNRLNELRLKLRNFQKKKPAVGQPEVTHVPLTRDETIEPVSAAPKPTDVPFYKKNRIPYKSANNPELSVILPNKIKSEPEISKRLTNWTSRLPSIKRIALDRLRKNEATIKPLKVPILTDDENKSEENVKEPKTTLTITEKPETKDELIELLKSGQNADRLQKILNSRNMTIQELLQNREKPPLQVNISTLFSSQEKHVPTTQPTLFDSLPDFVMEETDRPDTVAYDEPEAEESAPVIARVQLMSGREAKQYEFPVSKKGVSQMNLQPDDLPVDSFNTEDSALWKLSEKSMYYGSSYGYGEFPATQQAEKSKKVQTNGLTEDEIILLETIRRSQETNRKFKLNLNDFVHEEEEEPQTEDIEKSYIPPAVKSAIIASGVVMGLALFVFIAIFAACGWKQRQIRLKGASNGLGGTLSKRESSKRTLSPVSFKDTHSYKKTIDFGDETSESGTSNTSSYLWSTLKNTFTSRASTLKSRLEKEEKMREDKVTLRRNESRRKESRMDDRQDGDDVYTVKKIDRDRNVINTSLNFKRSPTTNNVNHFNECVHGY